MLPRNMQTHYTCIIGDVVTVCFDLFHNTTPHASVNM
jgi:hypothetical protein